MQLTPADAQMYWLSERIRNDQFLVFCFDAPGDGEAVRETVRRRTERMGELLCRVRDVPWNLDYPYWGPREFADDLVVEHRLADSTWTGLHSELGALVATSLDARTSVWRLHVFPGVRDAPLCDGPALVVVLQVSHAFADGRRATALARSLFGADEPPLSAPPRPAPSGGVMAARGVLGLPVRLVRLVSAGRRAAVADRALTRATAAGEVPPPAAGRPLVGLDADPGPGRVVRMVVWPKDVFRPGGRGAGGCTVTVVALTAVSVALTRFLEARGEDVPDRLGAEVTVAVAATDSARNNYRNVGVELFVTEPDLRVRAGLIAAELAARRERVGNPLLVQRDEANEFVPAPLLRFGTTRQSMGPIPGTVTGNTVVSSVFRGPADLGPAGGRAVFSAGFPGLSPVTALAHGVYGFGDTVTIGVTAGLRVVPDLEDYERILRGAVAEVGGALGGRRSS